MTLQEFINKWTGKPVDTDGVYPNQCMDLMHQYRMDVLGVQGYGKLGQPSAYLVYSNFENLEGKELFERIPNTPTGVPKAGDIMVWGQGIGAHGHVAIFVSGDVNGFYSFDANYPVGTLPHIQYHNYNSVSGWLRYKGTPLMEPTYYKGYDLNNHESMKVAVDQMVRILDGEFINKNELRSATIDGQTVGWWITEKGNREEQVNRLKGELETANRTIEELKKALVTGAECEKLRKADQKVIDAQKVQIDEQAKTIGTLTHTVDDRDTEIEQLKIQIEALKQNNNGVLTWGDVLLILWNKVKNLEIKKQ